MMKTFLALLTLLVSTAASAACYFIYSPSNEVVWRGMSAPVAMDSVAIDREVQKLVPKGHLVISNDAEALCSPLDLTTPRKTMRDRAEEMKYDAVRPSARM